MVLNYIGSKKTLAPRLVEELVKAWSNLENWEFCDAFSGTGAVAVAIASHVSAITVNDWEPFLQTILQAQFNPPQNVLSLIDTLNQTPPTTGAITLTYSEAAGRLYFTTLNAQRIDGIREALRSEQYTEQERNYLIGTLVSAADSVANVAAVYGAYLKDFKNSAQNLLNLRVMPPADKTANQNLSDIVKNTPARRLVLSYNNEGILTHNEIASIFTINNWTFDRVQIPYKRFASQKDLDTDTVEYLFLAVRS